MIEFTEEVCRNLDEATRREWLETNGLGGFAGSTVACLNTRRYHGLLVAATRPPVGRVVLLSKLEETLVITGRRYDLSANQYPGAVHPQGHRHLRRFRLDPFPVFTYEVEDFEIEKSVFMVYGENTTVIQYKISTPATAATDGENDACGPTSVILHPSSFILELRPLIAFRDYHATTHENRFLNPDFTAKEELLTFAPYEGMPSLHLAHAAEEVAAEGCWYRNFEYAVERERGLDFLEDLFCPCVLKFDLGLREKAVVIASTERRSIEQAGEYRRSEIERRARVLAQSPVEDEFVQTLVTASDQYLVARGRQKTVIAGYHWFSDWGRDTMIALPGLTLVTRRFDVAKSILLEFARHVDCGMLPNRFPDAGEAPEYNTVDATLWYFNAVHEFLKYTGDYDFVRENLYGVLKDITVWHERGTRYGIRVDSDGLLRAGEPGVQLTWMDVKIGDRVVTPRAGKAVEIQALWYNALRVMETLAHEFEMERDEERFASMAARAHRSFNRVFWNEEAGCLYDVVGDDGTPDATLRPNQIIAASLPFTCLSRERARRVVAVVERELLTPFGLRSLARGDWQYHSRYEGDGPTRDAAYHQGTIWPWLLGPFITAYVRANRGSVKSRRQAAALLEGVRAHLGVTGLGHVSEIFDAEEPHSPRGCVAQAWSVAEILRALVEDVRDESPRRGVRLRRRARVAFEDRTGSKGTDAR